MYVFVVDVENYIYFKTIKLKDGVVPYIFNCLKTRQPAHSTSTPSLYLLQSLVVLPQKLIYFYSILDTFEFDINILS